MYFESSNKACVYICLRINFPLTTLLLVSSPSGESPSDLPVWESGPEACTSTLSQARPLIKTCAVSSHQYVIEGVFLQEKCVWIFNQCWCFNHSSLWAQPCQGSQVLCFEKEHPKVRRVCDVVMPLQNNGDISQWRTVRIHALINPTRPVYHYDSRLRTIQTAHWGSCWLCI